MLLHGCERKDQFEMALVRKCAVHWGQLLIVAAGIVGLEAQVTGKARVQAET